MRYRRRGVETYEEEAGHWDVGCMEGRDAKY
jgi:hypothetical protein